MVRITKVYTKTGDKGKTTLAGGQKVSKASARIEAYGGVDELNSFLGIVGEYLDDQKKLTKLQSSILRIQNELFDLGSQLAVLAEDRRPDTPVITQTDIKRLEQEIDDMNQNLEPLKSFILPGGGKISAYLHAARTVCRRVERGLVKMSESESLDGVEIPYTNRLSDWLFVAARFVSRQLGKEENLWQPGKRE
ncbi:cob(I)yrinic acid a,c-diamide adenosyltransferase [candidate division KSB1 bacterium]|nr:cob(I)yrinic acid a,c-diamide adenosyltransferase [candidate division KSB1 bacterium]